MACRFEVLLEGGYPSHISAARDALAEVDRIESCLTIFREDGEVARLNSRLGSGEIPVSPELFEILLRSRELHAETEGAFDVTSLPLSRCWGFVRREPRLPSSEEVESARACVGMGLVELNQHARSVRFQRQGTELNFGSIGKGFALDQAGHLLRARGVRHALLSGGGSSALALGGSDGGFLVDVASPQALGKPLARLRLHEAALGTSGAGIQFLEVDGRRYGHVIDPRTGWPTSGVLSASVVATGAARADALSTAFLVGGCELAERYCATHADTMALVTPDDGSRQPRVFGSHAGARLLEA